MSQFEREESLIEKAARISFPNAKLGRAYCYVEMEGNYKGGISVDGKDYRQGDSAIRWLKNGWNQKDPVNWSCINRVIVP